MYEARKAKSSARTVWRVPRARGAVRVPRSLPEPRGQMTAPAFFRTLGL